jgi:hypothetical protein
MAGVITLCGSFDAKNTMFAITYFLLKIFHEKIK